MTVMMELPELHEGDPGHVEAHNTIRAILLEHDMRLRRIETHQGSPEEPDGYHRSGNPGALPNPELPDQPPKHHNPELPERTPSERPSYRAGGPREE